LFSHSGSPLLVLDNVDFHNFMNAKNALGITLIRAINMVCSLKSVHTPSLGVTSTGRIADVSDIGT
jgi:hypothetical protein